MVNRKTLECSACGTRVITRTSIGHGDSQIHSFSCPGCGVGITYKVLLDQKKGDLEYEPKPENATWVASETGVEHQVTFDAELLLPRDALTVPFLTPFMAARWLFSDFPTFQRQEAIRLWWRRVNWPITKRLAIHYENSNWPLFDADAAKIEEAPDDNTRLARLRLLRRVHDVPFEWMLLPEATRRSRVAQRIALASAVSPATMDELAHRYLSSGRLAELWRQLQSFHTGFVRDFPFLSPLLQPAVYWKKAEHDLTTFVVCDKRFSELKSLYIDSFETFARLSVIGIGVEAVIHHSSLDIPTKKGSLGLWDFEKLAHALKPDHLKKYPIEDLFSPHLGTTLRNGIGHNSARYDAPSDEVVCVKQGASSLSEERIQYTIFCMDVLRLVSALFHSEGYFYALLERVDGRLHVEA